MSLEVDLLRPVLSMPPVILMDGGSLSNSSSSSSSRLNIHSMPPSPSIEGGSRLNINSVPPSPIVEMPPSPAPLHHMVLEFPSGEDAYEYDEDGFVVEVRIVFLLIFSIVATNKFLLGIFYGLSFN